MGHSLNQPGRRSSAATTGTLVGAVVLAVSSLLAHWSPATVDRTAAAAVEHAATFEYSAPVASSVVYPDGRVDTGDPIFKRLVRQLDLAVAYTLDTSAPGVRIDDPQVALFADVSAGAWSSSLPLAPAAAVVDGAARLTARLDLDEIDRTVTEVSAMTGASSGSYQVSLRLQVSGAVSTADASIPLDAGPSLQMTVDEQSVQVPTAALAVSEEQSVPWEVAEPKVLRAGPLSTTVPTARWLAPAAAVVAFVAAGAMAIRDRNLARTDPHGIRALDGARLVPTHGLHVVGSIVDVTSAEALARIAEEYQSFVFHGQDRHDSWYVVSDGTTTFRYRVPA